MARIRKNKDSGVQMDSILEVLEGLSLSDEYYARARVARRKTAKKSLNERFRDAFLKAHSEKVEA
ncbi:hypothetical protein [Alteromonas sp. OM2203]|uniref:hypothetical protein n=1 Tax=Alteromonas sp. OM2203 TaxID=3398817 RepID=UPI003AF33A4D|tara:strand:+ start:416 stop:610 length:195 start_codon:yes stop_codon:yes gene_type:complete